MVIAGFVMAIVSLMLCCFPYAGFALALVGLILAIVGKRKKPEYRGLAIAAIVIAAISMLLNGALFVVSLLVVSNPEFLNWYIEYLENNGFPQEFIDQFKQQMNIQLFTSWLR